MSILLFLLLLPSVVLSCHPQCRWACDDPVCQAECYSVCQPPKCDVQCTGGGGTNCSPNCWIHKNADQCESETCPQAEIKCAQLTGEACTGCQVLCEPPVCSWHCIKPIYHCKEPTCVLQCERPACEYNVNSSGGTTMSVMWGLILLLLVFV